MLITDDKLLIDVARRNYDKYKVPTNLTSSIKTKRFYTNEDKADLDVKTSVNKIGEIINLSQQLNSLMWDRLSKGATFKDIEALYWDICKLAVLSNVEIDRAKREFVINSTTELNILKRKYKISDDERTVKPWFFKMITTENGFELSDNVRYKYFNTSMDYLQKIISKFNFRQGREQKRSIVPFMSMVNPPVNGVIRGYYYTQKDKIVNAIRSTRDATKRLYMGYDNMSLTEKESARELAWEMKQNCIEEIEKMSSCPTTMYLVLRELDKPETSDLSRYLFEVLFGRPDQAFFTMIKESKENVFTLMESEDGDISYYGYRFKKVNISGAETCGF